MPGAGGLPCYGLPPRRGPVNRVRPSAALTGLDADFIADDVIAGTLHKVFQLLPVDGRQRIGSGAGWRDKRRRGGDGYHYQDGFHYQLAPFAPGGRYPGTKAGAILSGSPPFVNSRSRYLAPAPIPKAGRELPGLDFPMLALVHGF